ncbi:MAG: peptidyl-prolyl cis-trans isomerase [Chitinispirillaceae bacterium]|nr:peptidyl-prolyl cis-trans isomerase [Chitinispirillaceae bacterium]
MNRIVASLCAVTVFSTFVRAQNLKTRVSIMTSKGEIVVELDSAKAPKTVGNFLDYVNSGFYNGTIFHRVIKGFMIQGGGFTPDMSKKKTNDPIPNEATNRLSNRRGTIAMARTNDPHSATAQFFINTVDNGARGLDFRSESEGGWGYCVFGKVVKGMPVVDAIEGVQTASKGMMGDVPVTPILITKVSVIKETPAPAEKK